MDRIAADHGYAERETLRKRCANMSTQRTSQYDGTVGVYDPLGQDSETAPYFIRHIGLSLRAFEFKVGEVLHASLIEMVPPLSVPNEADLESQESVAIDILANMDLTASEISRIKMFIDELVDEYLAASTTSHMQYTILPHFRDRNSDDSVRRYSCVGFVVEAYRDTDVELIDLPRLPDVELGLLVLAYPDQESHLRHPRLRAFCGLNGDGPWPVLMPGYVFHALNRPPQTWRQTPYVAQSGDERFPRSAPTPQTSSPPLTTDNWQLTTDH